MRDRRAAIGYKTKPVFADYPARAAWCTPAAGGADLGWITDEAALAIGVQPGPIRLPDGVPTYYGYGRLHIESTPGRVGQMHGLGFRDAFSFVCEVAANWNRLLSGEDDRLIAVWRRGANDLKIVVGWEPPVWSVVTAFPTRQLPEQPIFTRPSEEG